MKISFINLKYLDDIIFDMEKEVSLLIGENGSGKSLLTKHIRFIAYLLAKDLSLFKILPSQIYDSKYNEISFNDFVVINSRKPFGYNIFIGERQFEILFKRDRRKGILKLDSLKMRSILENKLIIGLRTFDGRQRINQEIKEFCETRFEEILDAHSTPVKIGGYNLMGIQSEGLNNKLTYFNKVAEKAENNDMQCLELEINVKLFFEEFQSIVKDGSMFKDELNEYFIIDKEFDELILRSVMIFPELDGTIDFGYNHVMNNYIRGCEDFEAKRAVERLMHLGILNFEFDGGEISLRNEIYNSIGFEYDRNIALNSRKVRYHRSLHLSKDDIYDESELFGFWSIMDDEMSILNSGLRLGKYYCDTPIEISRDMEGDIIDQIELFNYYYEKASFSFKGSRYLGGEREYSKVSEARSVGFEFKDSVISVKDGHRFGLLSAYMNDKGYRSEIFVKAVNNVLEFDNVVINYFQKNFDIIEINVVSRGKSFGIASLSQGERHVIITFLEILYGENLIFLNEPDVYLHPNMQSKFFREIFKIKHGKRLIIETHSPYFIREMQLMQAEGIHRDEGIGISKRVIIYYRSKSDSSLNRMINVKENGDLSSEIPPGFSDHLSRLNMLRLQLLD